MNPGPNFLTRRQLLKTGGTVTATTLAGLSLLRYGYGANLDTIRVGLVGCGGRGTGAARDVLRAGPGIELVAMGDVIASQIEKSLKRLAGFKTDGGQPLAGIRVSPDRRFTGLDAYRKVIDSDIDYVLLCTPPGFRPEHVEYAVERGVHIFAEKPCATDPPGVRRILALEPEIRRKSIGFLAGFNGRHISSNIEGVDRIHNGHLGVIMSLHAYFNTGNIWYRDRLPGMSLPEYHFYNWFHVDWLCGDHIVEQHVHNLDHANWVMREHPIGAYGMGGRQYHTDRGGNIYDHFAVEYEYPGGVRMTSMCRQISGTDNKIGEDIIGTMGTAIFGKGGVRFIGRNAAEIKDRPGQHESHWQEHIDFITALRRGDIMNDARILCESTLTAIMGREAAYTGKHVTWRQILDSPLTLTPRDIAAWDGSIRPVPKPGMRRV